MTEGHLLGKRILVLSKGNKERALPTHAVYFPDLSAHGEDAVALPDGGAER
jgi:hypothetical protein